MSSAIDEQTPVGKRVICYPEAEISLQKKQCKAELALDAFVARTTVRSSKEYLEKRCDDCDGKTVFECLQLQYLTATGEKAKYSLADLRYDVKSKRLEIVENRTIDEKVSLVSQEARRDAMWETVRGHGENAAQIPCLQVSEDTASITSVNGGVRLPSGTIKKEEFTPGKPLSASNMEITPVKEAASKELKVRKVVSTAKEDKSYGLVNIGSSIVQKAESAGLCSALLNLAMKVEIREKHFSDEQLFHALQKANGNSGKAQQALLMQL